MLNAINTLSARIDTLTGFHRWGPDANPVIQQAKRRSGRLSLRGALWFAFGIGLLGAAITSWQFLTTSSDQLNALDQMLLLLGWSLYALTPLVTSYWAVRHMRLVRRSVRFDALYLTPQPNFKLIEGFVFEALYAIRYTLAVLIGIMPALIIKSMQFVLVNDVHWQVQPTYGWSTPELTPPTVASIVIPTLYALAIALGGWGLTLLAAVSGVHLGLLRKSSELAFIAAPTAILSTLICPCVVCFCSLPALIIPDINQVCGGLLAIGLPQAIIMLPFLLAINGIILTAKLWNR